MAERAWRPASPKSCWSRSEAPLMTAGCAPNSGPNGYDNQNGDGDRYQRHRRRRHRGPGGPRPDLTGAPQDLRTDDGPEPGNS